jgi:hypothetical protein
MKHALLIPIAATFLVANSFAQDRIYRCGNEYTNTVPAGQKHNCKLLEGGNVTVVQSQRPAAAAPVRVAAATQSGQRVDAPEQRSRDSDARQILESELKRSQARREELLKEYNNGEPEKLGPETRNHQKYLDRVAELKAHIDRNDSDISGIQREIGRVAPANNAASKY